MTIPRVRLPPKGTPAVNLIRFACPHCRKALRIPAEHAGKGVRCPNAECHRAVRVPEASPAPVDAEDEAFRLLGGKPARPRTPTRLTLPVLSDDRYDRSRQVREFGSVDHPDVGRLL